MRELPAAFLSSMTDILGEDYPLFAASQQEESVRGIRFSTLKADGSDIEEVLDLLGEDALPVPWCPAGYYTVGDSRPALLPHYAAGLFYIQEPSAMAPAELLPVGEHDRVLDLCAAPGGKSTRLGEKAGFLLANDISVSRARALVKNLELAGIGNAAVTAADPVDLKKHFSGYFDAILVDAPCSGEGMFRRDPTLISSWQDRGPEYYHPLQTSILDSAYEMLIPGGRLLYSTCTFSPQEDELTLEVFLDKHPDMSLVEIPLPEDTGIERGLRGLRQALRFYPHRLRGEGHFAALMKKDARWEHGNADEDSGTDPVSGRDAGEEASSRETLIKSLRRDDSIFLIRGDLDPYTKRGVRYLRTGLHAGTLDRSGRFRPAHALALHSVLPSADARVFEAYVGSERFECSVLSLSYGDERISRYLRGETLEAPGLPQGTCLVAMGRHPLGFGRISGSRLKNDYPKGYINS